MAIDKGKILIEGMDLSGKTTVVQHLNSIMKVDNIQCRTLNRDNYIHDFAVQQSKAGTLPRQLISELYELAIKEDLCKYRSCNQGYVLQD